MQRSSEAITFALLLFSVSPTLCGQDHSGPSVIRADGTSFTIVARANARGEGGGMVPLTAYKAPDGTGLSLLDPEFDSAAKATEYFETRLAKAQKVTARTKERSSSGQIIGERAEAVFPNAGGSSVPAILWADGRVFLEIDSRSLSLSRKLKKALTQ